MIAQLLPAGVAVAESYDDPPGLALFPQEEALIASSVEKRRREFTTVRHCARQALAALGLPAGPILPGERGAPRWPDGVVGSMTHCAGYRAAVLGRRSGFATLGVDAEPHAPLPDGVLDVIALPAERERLASLATARPAICWDRLLFSAKESVYKAWFPLTRRWLDFSEADVVVDPAAGLFHATLLVPGPVLGGTRLGTFTGRYAVERGLVVTAISVRAPT